MGEQEETINITLMDGARTLELIQNLDFSWLKPKERIVMELYRRYGLSSGIEISMTDICSIAYPEYPVLFPRKREGRYGDTLQVMRRLEAQGIVKRMENPARYKLINNQRSRNYIKYILRKRFNTIVQDNIIF